MQANQYVWGQSLRLDDGNSVSQLQCQIIKEKQFNTAYYSIIHWPQGSWLKADKNEFK